MHFFYLFACCFFTLLIFSFAFCLQCTTKYTRRLFQANERWIRENKTGHNEQNLYHGTRQIVENRQQQQRNGENETNKQKTVNRVQSTQSEIALLFFFYSSAYYYHYYLLARRTNSLFLHQLSCRTTKKKCLLSFFQTIIYLCFRFRMEYTYMYLCSNISQFIISIFSVSLPLLTSLSTTVPGDSFAISLLSGSYYLCPKDRVRSFVSKISAWH